MNVENGNIQAHAHTRTQRVDKLEKWSVARKKMKSLERQKRKR